MADVDPRIEYRVRPVTRYIVTRFTNPHDPRGVLSGAGRSEQRGEYDNYNTAHAVAYALCKAEHDTLGWPPGDERIQYPRELSPTDVALSADAAALGLRSLSGAAPDCSPLARFGGSQLGAPPR